MIAYISTGDVVKQLQNEPGAGKRGCPYADMQVIYEMMQPGSASRFATIVYDNAQTARRRSRTMRKTAVYKGWPICLAWRGRTVTVIRIEDDLYDDE